MRAGWLAVMVCGVAMAGVAQTATPAAVGKEDSTTSGNVVKSLKVTFLTNKGEEGGTATFKPAKGGGVKVKLELRNMPIGVHGVHVHQNAVCEAPDFKTAGPHFNPDGKQHGFENPMGHHNGDAPVNVIVQEGYKGEATFVMTGVSLDKTAPNSLFLNGGTSIVIHEKADDMKTDPSGASGNRIACALIR